MEDNNQKKKNYPHSLSSCELWGQRVWPPRPTLYQAQGPRQERRNARGRTKKAQITKQHRRGQSCPRPARIVDGKSGMPPKACSHSIPRKMISIVGQPWELGGGAIQGETITSTFNAHNQRSDCINEEMIPK